jgi:hypothetical protein
MQQVKRPQRVTPEEWARWRYSPAGKVFFYYLHMGRDGLTTARDLGASIDMENMQATAMRAVRDQSVISFLDELLDKQLFEQIEAHLFKDEDEDED